MRASRAASSGGKVLLAALPLIQQATRPYAWRHWFESVRLSSQKELMGPCYELFSMLMQAAAVGLGVALIPEYDLDDEVTAGRLIVPIDRACPSDRDYSFVTPERKAANPLPAVFGALLATHVPTTRVALSRP